MSSSILRRNSSKQGLQNLQKITAQRSLEDAEEIERERRRRARASVSREPSQTTVTPQDSPHTTQNLDNQGQDDLVSSCHSSLEEDEGFSDWTQHLSRRKEGKMRHEDVEPHLNGSRHSELCSSSAQERELHQSDLNAYETTPFINTPSSLLNQQEVDDDDHKDWGAREWERRDKTKEAQREKREIRRWCEEEETTGKLKDHESSSRENQRCDMEKKGSQKKTEMKISFTSTLLLQQDGRNTSTNGQETRRINQCVSEEVFVVNSEENQQHRETEAETQAHEEVQRRMREEERDRKRKDVMERLKRLSTSSADPEEPFSPVSPNSPSNMAEGEDCQSESSITERTESLNRSVKKRNSLKKTPSPTIISKLEGRLEQYNHAVEECCKEGKGVKQPLTDVQAPPEPVSARKSLFEGGEAWNQSSGKATPSKDTEGLKVGVADLINQWVKGNSDADSKNPSSKIAEVKAGEVRNIKSMWENKGDSSEDKPCAKGSTGKRYKFVESGHGKYEKVLVNDD